jgi:hypothetical protein
LWQRTPEQSEGERGAAKSKIQFNGAGGMPTHISFTQGADDMSEHEWTSYSHWGMFLTPGNVRNNRLRQMTGEHHSTVARLDGPLYSTAKNRLVPPTLLARLARAIPK